MIVSYQASLVYRLMPITRPRPTRRRMSVAACGPTIEIAFDVGIISVNEPSTAPVLRITVLINGMLSMKLMVRRMFSHSSVGGSIARNVPVTA